MNRKVIFGTLLLLLSTAMTYAQQPYAGSWQPSDIINWSAENDADAKFNRSTVALQPRVSETNATAIKANSTQFVEGQHAPCLLITPSCSTCPSQGENNNFIGNNPTYWQYIDMLVWWAGSAAEGLFCLPDPGTIDIAHLNGVKVLAQLFFPPTYYGGNAAHVTAVKSQVGSTYPYAEKMAEIANFYGFDGWFINEETSNSESGWNDWIAYYQSYCASKGWNQHIQWYDASTGTTSLVNNTNTSKFREYGATTAANGSNFDKYYYGIECAQKSYGTNCSYFTNLFGTSQHYGSLASFNPDYPTWKQPVWENGTSNGTANITGSSAYSLINTFFTNEAKWYVNPSQNPSASRTSGATWPGLATAMVERSAVTSLPFVTSFSHGQGKARYVNGENRGTMDWYHRGMQDVLPTWRYWSSGTATITPNWDNVYNMGTSLKVVNSTTNNTIYLYKADVAVTTGCTAQLVVKGITSGLTLRFATGGSGLVSNLTYTNISSSSSTTRNGWTILTYDLSSLAGKNIKAVALQVGSTGTMYLGQFALLPAAYAPTQHSVNNLVCQNEQSESVGSARVMWDAPADASDVHHYNVYLVRKGVTTLVGQTRDEGFYIPKFDRDGSSEKNYQVIVKTVTKDLEEEGTGTTLTINFPEMAKPEVSISASPTLCTTGTQVTCTVKATNYPTSYNWSVPANATLVSGQGTSTAVFTFSAEGKYDITCTVGNEAGATEKTEKKLINVSAETYNCAIGATTPISQNKTVYVSGYTNTNENGPKLVDGDTTGSKWCVGAKSSYAIIDLGATYELYETKLYDCRVSEDYENLENFNIYVGNDTTEWTLVAAVTGLPERPGSVGTYDYNIITTWLKPCVARYVKFEPYNEEKLITVRAYEFQVFGCSYVSPIKLSSVDDMSVNMEESREVNMTYTGLTPGETPTVTVKLTDTKSATISDLVYSAADASGNGTISFRINGVSEAKANTCIVKLSTEEESVVSQFGVKVTNPNRINLLSGLTATLYYSRSYLAKPTDISDTFYWKNGKGTTSAITDGNDEIGYSFTPNSSDKYYVIEFEIPESLAVGAGEDWSEIRMFVSNSAKVASWKVLVSATGENTSSAWTVLASGSTFGTDDFSPSFTDPCTVDGTRFVRFYFELSVYYAISFNEFEAYKKDMTVGIDAPQVEAVQGSRIYPNPLNVNGNLRIESENMSNIAVYTLQGALVESRAVSGNAVTMPLNGYGVGSYLLVITDEKGARTFHKVVVK